MTMCTRTEYLMYTEDEAGLSVIHGILSFSRFTPGNRALSTNELCTNAVSGAGRKSVWRLQIGLIIFCEALEQSLLFYQAATRGSEETEKEPSCISTAGAKAPTQRERERQGKDGMDIRNYSS